LDDYTCVADDPPPGDGGSGSGGGTGGGSGGVPGGGSGDGTGGGGSGGGTGTDPATCGSIACESTVFAMSGKIGDVLTAINTTRSIELAGILDTAKKSDAKSAIIAALGQQAVDYIFDLISKEATQVAQNTDLLSKLQDLTGEIKGIEGKQDIFSDQFANKLDALTNKIDPILQKQDIANGNLDLIKNDLDQSLIKQDMEKSTLDELLSKEAEGVDKLDLIKNKLDEQKPDLDKLSWLEKLGKLDLLGDILDGITSIPDLISNLPNLVADIANKLAQLPDAIKQKLDFCADHPDWLFCPAQPPEIDPQTLDTRDISVTVSPMISDAGLCPADRVATLSSGQQLRFSFDYICQLASAHVLVKQCKRLPAPKKAVF
jgi:hypothetical protein